MKRTGQFAGLIFVSGLGLVCASLSGLLDRSSAPTLPPVARRAERTSVEVRPLAGQQPGNPQPRYRFEQNRGQFEAPVRFLARGKGYGLFLTREGATLSLQRPGGGPAVLNMRLAGGRQVEPAGIGELPGRNNYFVGNDRSRWRTDVPSFGRVRYAQVLPGVDLEYYGTDERQAEYDLVLAPGTDPARLELQLSGAESMRIEADGSAVLALAGGGQVRKPPPVAYQDDTSGGRIQVAVRYQQRSGDRLGFTVGPYDRGRALVIDPVFAYSTLLGGSASESAQAVAVDGSGNAYLVGYTQSPNFPVVSGFQGTNRSTVGGNVFVTKLGPSGAPSPVYSTYLGGTGAEGDRAFGVAVDGSGNAYVVGEASSADFPLQGALQTTLNGSRDAFVTKLNATGSALVYSTYLGGEAIDSAGSVAVDSAGNAYITGETASNAFPIKAPALQATKNTPPDVNTVFVTKLNAAGSALVYSTYLGGSDQEYGGAIAIDASGNAYVTGTTGSASFPMVSAFQSTLGLPLDAFVSKINAAGSALVYSTYLGGTGLEFAKDIAVDGSGNAYVTGFTTATNFPTKTPIQASNNAALSTTAFVTKLNAAGNTLGYSTYLGGTVEDVGMGLAVDSGGNAYVTGYTRSPDFRSASPVQTYGGERDAFVSKLNPAGSALVFSTHLGGAADEVGTGIAADSAGSAYVTGESGSWNFPTPQTAFQPFLSGDTDAFAVKLAASGSFPPIKPKTRQDAILLSANATNASGCGGVAFSNARTLTVTDQNGDGLVCPGCAAGNTYAAADALDFIKLAFYGLHHDASKTRNCGSDVRRTLLANYNNLLQNNCGAGSCAGKPIHHLWRPSEISPAVATLNGLLGTTTAQFCNVHTATVIAAQGTDFLDNDPVRVTCTGNGKTFGEQVCGSAFEGKLHNLGTLLTVFIPDPGDAPEAYAVNYCTTGANALLPATKSTYTGLCPAGNPSFGGKCFSSVFRINNPDGSSTNDANCVQFNSFASCPILTPAGTDCRGAGLWLRDSDGNIVKDTTFAPGMVPPNTGRLITGAFFKILATAPLATGGAVCGTADTADAQIACLSSDADSCSLGLVTRKGLTPVPASMAAQAVGGVLPDDPGVYYAAYPLSF